DEVCDRASGSRRWLHEGGGVLMARKRRRGKVLLVENDRNFRTTVKQVFELAGYQVLESSGSEGVPETVAKEEPLVAIVDVRLRDDDDPYDSSGIQLLKLLPTEVGVLILAGHRDLRILRIEGRKPDRIFSKGDDLTQIMDYMAETYDHPKWSKGEILGLVLATALLFLAIYLWRQDVFWGVVGSLIASLLVVLHNFRD